MKNLSELYHAHSGKFSDKWESYLSFYENEFHAYRHKPIRIVEVGVQNGGSLEIWGKYFPKATSIIGVDINEKCKELEFEDPRIKVIVGDINDTSIYDGFKCSEKFDIFIDDGSHTSRDIVKTFLNYFPMVNSGGVFVAEDLHCSYWGRYNGGLYHPFSSMSFFKRLADVINIQHWGVDHTIQNVLGGFFAEYKSGMEEEDFGSVTSVKFVNSICSITKGNVCSNSLGSRVLVGKDRIINFGNELPKPNEQKNPWSIREAPPEEKIVSLEKKNELLSNRIHEMECSGSWRITRPLRLVREKLLSLQKGFK